jgi:hypothetical protein
LILCKHDVSAPGSVSVDRIEQVIVREDE